MISVACIAGREVDMGWNRMTFAVGFAAGFVAGTRAGREKYDQMVKFARETAEKPAVQQAAGVVQAQATGLAQKLGGQIQEKVPQMAHSAVHSVGSHMPGKSKNGHGGSASNGGKGASNGSPFAATNSSNPGKRSN
jgi:hypothetical protein